MRFTIHDTRLTITNCQPINDLQLTMRLPEILFENDEFIALNKPAGLLSVPDRTQSAPSLKDLLIEKYRRYFYCTPPGPRNQWIDRICKNSRSPPVALGRIPGTAGRKNILWNRLGCAGFTKRNH